MKIGSLFSGIGGLDLACEEVFGGRTVWQVEGIDLGTAALAETHPVSRKTWAKLRSYARHGEFNRRVLARHWPRARQMCDVRTAGAHNLEAVDVICGSFPCQNLSVIGHVHGVATGIDGDRSGLFREMVRIAGELMPRHIVIENVPALARHIDAVGAALADIGYGLCWTENTAASVGAPHLRRRVFVVATRWQDGVYRVATGADAQPASGLWPTPNARDFRSGAGAKLDRGHTPQLPEVCGGLLNPEWVEGLMGLHEGWTDPDGKRLHSPQWPAPQGEGQAPGEPARLVEPRSVRDRCARLKSLGNAVVPQQAAAALRACLDGPAQMTLWG